MSDTTTVPVQAGTHESLTRAGRWCAAAGVIGFVQGGVVLAWPRQVDSSRFSYPFTARWDVIAQATFFLQHLPLLAAVAALTALPLVRRDKLAHRGLVAAGAGLGLLALMELIAMSAATTTNDSTLAVVVSSLYSVPVIMIGAGLLVAGIVLLRRRVLDRRLSGTLLALGAFVFVGLVPAISTNSFVAGRLVIMVWMALFALLGLVMQRSAR